MKGRNSEGIFKDLHMLAYNDRKSRAWGLTWGTQEVSLARQAISWSSFAYISRWLMFTSRIMLAKRARQSPSEYISSSSAPCSRTCTGHTLLRRQCGTASQRRWNFAWRPWQSCWNITSTSDWSKWSPAQLSQKQQQRHSLLRRTAIDLANSRNRVSDVALTNISCIIERRACNSFMGLGKSLNTAYLLLPCFREII